MIENIDSKYIQSTNHDEYTLTNGSFYGVYIPDSYGELKRYEFINDGVLLIFNTETFYLKINKSCPKNQILNSQTNTTGDIFNFKYDENLLAYENSLYSLANISSGYIYFLRDAYHQCIMIIHLRNFHQTFQIIHLF